MTLTLPKSVVANQLIAPPLTRNYRPSAAGMPAWMGFGLGGQVFDLSTVDIMMLDSTVALGIAMLEAPISTAEGWWDIKTDDAEVGNFVNRTMQRFWATSLPIALQAIRYGYCGSEVLYHLDPHTKQVNFNRLLAIHPRDCRVLTQDSQFAGIRVKATANHTPHEVNTPFPDLNGPDISRPSKGFWFYHGTSYNVWYGKSRLWSAWMPWRDKCGRDGALDIVRMWYYKLSFTGPKVYHPERDQLIDGMRIPARDMARQMVEWMKAGAGVAMPNTVDPKTGAPYWKIEEPHINGNADGLLDYVKWLDSQITRGLLIPDGVVTEATAGGGYSARKVPEDAFYVLEERIFHDLVVTLNDLIIRPLVQLNYGLQAEYVIDTRPLVPIRQQAAQQAAEAQGNALGGDPNNPMAKILAGQDGAENAEAEAMRNEGGTSGGANNQLARMSHEPKRIPLSVLDSQTQGVPGCMPRPKITRQAFVYLDPTHPEKEFGQCSTCSNWSGPETKLCRVHGPNVSVSGIMSCRLYVPGIPDPAIAQSVEACVTPEESGLVTQPMRCEDCVFFGKLDSDCSLFHELNDTLPTIYQLDCAVNHRGRCNSFEPIFPEWKFSHQYRFAAEDEEKPEKEPEAEAKEEEVEDQNPIRHGLDVEQRFKYMPIKGEGGFVRDTLGSKQGGLGVVSYHANKDHAEQMIEGLKRIANKPNGHQNIKKLMAAIRSHKANSPAGGGITLEHYKDFLPKRKVKAKDGAQATDKTTTPAPLPKPEPVKAETAPAPEPTPAPEATAPKPSKKIDKPEPVADDEKPDEMVNNMHAHLSEVLRKGDEKSHSFGQALSAIQKKYGAEGDEAIQRWRKLGDMVSEDLGYKNLPENASVAEVQRHMRKAHRTSLMKNQLEDLLSKDGKLASAESPEAKAALVRAFFDNLRGKAKGKDPEGNRVATDVAHMASEYAKQAGHEVGEDPLSYVKDQLYKAAGIEKAAKAGKKPAPVKEVEKVVQQVEAENPEATEPTTEAAPTPEPQAETPTSSTVTPDTNVHVAGQDAAPPPAPPTTTPENAKAPEQPTTQPDQNVQVVNQPGQNAKPDEPIPPAPGEADEPSPPAAPVDEYNQIRGQLNSLDSFRNSSSPESKKHFDALENLAKKKYLDLVKANPNGVSQKDLNDFRNKFAQKMENLVTKYGKSVGTHLGREDEDPTKDQQATPQPAPGGSTPPPPPPPPPGDSTPPPEQPEPEKEPEVGSEPPEPDPEGTPKTEHAKKTEDAVKDYEQGLSEEEKAKHEEDKKTVGDSILKHFDGLFSSDVVKIVGAILGTYALYRLVKAHPIIGMAVAGGLLYAHAEAKRKAKEEKIPTLKPADEDGFVVDPKQTEDILHKIVKDEEDRRKAKQSAMEGVVKTAEKKSPPPPHADPNEPVYKSPGNNTMRADEPEEPWTKLDPEKTGDSHAFMKTPEWRKKVHEQQLKDLESIRSKSAKEGGPEFDKLEALMKKSAEQFEKDGDVAKYTNQQDAFHDAIQELGRKHGGGDGGQSPGSGWPPTPGSPPPVAPSSGSSGVNGDPSTKTPVAQKIKSLVDYGPQGISPKYKESVHKAIDSFMESIPESVHERLAENIKKVQVFRGPDELKKHFSPRDWMAIRNSGLDKALGLYAVKDKAIFLNSDDVKDHETEDVLHHELWHAVDGPEFELSRSQEMRDAFENDLNGDKQWRNAVFLMVPEDSVMRNSSMLYDKNPDHKEAWAYFVPRLAKMKSDDPSGYAKVKKAFPNWVQAVENTGVLPK